MNGKQHTPAGSRLGRFARGRRLDRNPLRRASDVTETVVMAVLVTAFAVGAPFVAWAASAWLWERSVAHHTPAGGATYLFAMIAVAAFAGVLGDLWLVARYFLDRHRMAAWDAAWRSAGPRWAARA